MKSYEELITHLYSPANQAKIEWAIGSALAGGPKKILIICGPAASGKSTMLKIVEGIFAREGFPDDVVTQHDGLARMKKPGRLFAAMNVPMVTENTHMIVATPTGNRHSRLTHYRLTAEVESETDEISNACLARYLELGPNYYEDVFLNNYQENEK